MLKWIFSLVILFGMNVTAHTQKFTGKDKDIQQILQNIKTFSEHYMNSDHEAIAKCYTEDGIIFPSRIDFVQGQEAIAEWWTIPEEVTIKFHKITPKEITIVKKTAYDYGYYEGETLKPDGTSISWKGKYVIVWKKIGKEWKMYLDIWNRIDMNENK